MHETTGSRGAAVAGLAAAIALAAAPRAAGQTTVTLAPDRDTFVTEFQPWRNYGSWSFLFQSGRRNRVGRVLLGFDLSAVPSGARVTSATLSLYKFAGHQQGSRIAVHAVTRAWAEGTAPGNSGASWIHADRNVPWTNRGGDYASPAVDEVRIANGGGWKQWDVTALVQAWVDGTQANHGLLLRAPNERGRGQPLHLFASREGLLAPVLTVTYDLNVADIVVVKSALTDADPVNGTTNPKSIPGATVLYALTTTNQGPQPADRNSVAVVDAIPANTSLYVTDLGGAGSGPVLFRDGPVPSGLRYRFRSLGHPADDLQFSDDGGATWSYTPVPDALGTDRNVTHVRVTPTGVLSAATGAGPPQFELRFRVRVN